MFVAVLVIAFLNMAAWSIATPLFASPDEPAQVARAVALVHGDLIGTTVKNAGTAITDITVPAVYSYRSGAAYGSCFVFQPRVPASCARPITHSTAEVASTTYVGRYPPLYYAIVGLPSLITSSSTGIYLIRLVSALLNAAFLALAALSVVAWSRSRVLLIGLLIATTPMTFFLGGVVNPSGFEITSATCLWCSGMVLALERADNVPPGLVAVVTASAAALLLSRSLSPLWVVLIVAFLALLCGWRGVRALARVPSVRWSLAVLVPCGVVALGWIVVAHAFDELPVGLPVGHEVGWHLALSIFGNTGSWVQQMVGVFGWLDTTSPALTYLVWYVAVGMLILTAVSCTKPRYAGVLALLICTVLAVPVIISYGEAHHLGVIWQGRYIMPMAVGVPLMSAALIGGTGLLRPVQGRLSTLLCVVIGIAEFAAFAEALRRYTTGVGGPLDYLHGPWQPPLGATAVTVGAFLVIGLSMVLIRSLIAADPAPAGGSGRQRVAATAGPVLVADGEAAAS